MNERKFSPVHDTRPMDDRFLIREAQKGDRSAFDKLIGLYQKKVYNYSLRITNDPDLSEDLCQEAFLKAFLGLRSFRGQSAFTTWLYRIVYNTFLDHYRKEGHRSHQHRSMDDDGRDLAENDVQLFYDRLNQTESGDWITKGLVQLPFMSRTLLLLRDIQGFSYQEIAEITDSSIGTVKSRLNRARELLRKILSSTDWGV
jgi:RNA polymerase sigma-70 factor, ECF subfamily